MNGFTFIALILIGWYIVELAIAIINTAALYIARWQGKQRDSSKYYFRCTSEACPGRTGVAVVRKKPVEDKGGK